MADTYDEQIEAILAGDMERLATAIGVDKNDIDIPGNTIFFGAWAATADEYASLFANLPGCSCCASQIHTPSERPKGSKEAEFYNLIRLDNKKRLYNPGTKSKPTREILNEFARRQRLCRAHGA